MCGVWEGDQCVWEGAVYQCVGGGVTIEYMSMTCARLLFS